MQGAGRLRQQGGAWPDSSGVRVDSIALRGEGGWFSPLEMSEVVEHIEQKSRVRFSTVSFERGFRDV